ncbi:MAG: hypothetical protein AB7E49_08425 [Campylobacterales bacterium]
MNVLMLDVALLFFIEIVEANLQKGRSFNELVNRLFALKKSRPLQFVLLHTSFFYVLFYAITSGNFSGWFFALLLIKGADIGLKLHLFARMEQEQEAFSSERFFGAPDMPLSPALRYAGAFLYSAIFAAGVFSA